MLIDNTIPEPNVVLELLEAFRRSKTMFAAVELGIFDALLHGEKSCEELSAELQCNSDALLTLLESCAGLGLLTQNKKLFSNSPVANTYLTSSSPHRMTGYIRYSNDVMWKMWGNLEDAVREGSHRWKQTFGFDGPIFSHFFNTPQAMEEFLMGMHGFGMITSPKLVDLFDLSKFRSLCDLGGATGHLAIAACKRNSHLQGIVFDLPHALDLANRMVQESGLQERIKIIGGDFFTDELPEADLFALGRILHDWDEPRILILLKKIYDKLPPGGGLLIGEKIVNETRNGPSWAQMQSLNMLVCTEGKERSATEYATLLKSVGFTQINVSKTSLPLDAILATK